MSKLKKLKKTKKLASIQVPKYLVVLSRDTEVATSELHQWRYTKAEAKKYIRTNARPGDVVRIFKRGLSLEDAWKVI